VTGTVYVSTVGVQGGRYSVCIYSRTRWPVLCIYSRSTGWAVLCMYLQQEYKVCGTVCVSTVGVQGGQYCVSTVGIQGGRYCIYIRSTR
jgi:hypothetical protein